MPPWSDSDSGRVIQIGSDDGGGFSVEIDANRLRELYPNIVQNVADGEFGTEIDRSHSFTITTNETVERGHPIEFMDTPSIEYWVVQEALNRDVLDNIVDAACGERYDEVEGAAGVARLLIENASEEITQRTYGDDYVQPFNEVTSGWPREARAILIQYEYENADRPDDSSYMDDLERFTSEGDGPNIPEVGEGIVPSRDFLSDLSPTPRSTALLLSADGAEASADDLESVSDHRRFRELYESCENIEDALRAESLDGRLPLEVALAADAPEDWPDDLEPFAVDQQTCIRCGNSYNEISIDGESAFVDERGDPIHVTPAGPNDPFRFLDGPPGSGCVCGSCEAQFEDACNTVAYLDPEAGIHTLLEREGNLIYDHGHVEGTDFTPQTRLSPNEQQRIDDRGSLEDFFEISPNGDFGDVSAQRNAIRSLTEDPGDLSAGPVLVVDSRNRTSAYVQRTNFEAASEVKEIIEENVNNV